jgi:hypothetical protein
MGWQFEWQPHAGGMRGSGLCCCCGSCCFRPGQLLRRLCGLGVSACAQQLTGRGILTLDALLPSTYYWYMCVLHFLCRLVLHIFNRREKAVPTLTSYQTLCVHDCRSVGKRWPGLFQQPVMPHVCVVHMHRGCLWMSNQAGCCVQLIVPVLLALCLVERALFCQWCNSCARW